MVFPNYSKIDKGNITYYPSEYAYLEGQHDYFPLNTCNLMLGMEQLGWMCQFEPDKSYRYVNSGSWENMGWQGEYLSQYKTIHVIIYNHLIISLVVPCPHKVANKYMTGSTGPVEPTFFFFER